MEDSSQSNNKVGERLRSVRMKFGYSQRRLAKLSGVSNASISLIEKDKINPSLGTLIKLLSVFELSMAEFWQIEPNKHEQVFFQFNELKKIASHQVTFWQVNPLAKNNLIFQYEKYDVGADTGESKVSIDCEMVGIVIEGRIDITVAEHSKILGPGDAYRFNGRMPHRFRAQGNKPVIMVSSTTPAVF